MRPINGSGVTGAVIIRSVDDGVKAKLALRNLARPDAFYLADGHPAPAPHGRPKGEEEEHHHGEHAGVTDQEIEWPLSEVRPDAHGNGSSSNTLKHTSMEKVFSGQLKHVNVHAVGSGNPPVLACVALKR